MKLYYKFRDWVDTKPAWAVDLTAFILILGIIAAGVELLFSLVNA